MWESPRKLDDCRVSGDSSPFHRLGNRVQHLRPDLDLWATKRRATTTVEADKLDTLWEQAHGLHAGEHGYAAVDKRKS